MCGAALIRLVIRENLLPRQHLLCALSAGHMTGRTGRISALTCVVAIVSFGGMATAAAAGEYAVIFDAGSTGTRIHIYKRALDDAASIPTFRTKNSWSLKVKPGISSYSDNPAGSGASILPLLKLAQRVIPDNKKASAMVMLGATAGMRLLPPQVQAQIHDALYASVRDNSGLVPRRQDFSTISGIDEGVYGWLRVNMLLSKAKRLSDSDLGSIAVLDLGGASTQITLPSPTVVVPSDSQVEKRTLLAGRARTVYSHSYIGFGNQEAMMALTPSEAAACLARDARASGAWTRTTDPLLGNRAELNGTGVVEDCVRGIRRTLSSFAISHSNHS